MARARRRITSPSFSVFSYSLLEFAVFLCNLPIYFFVFSAYNIDVINSTLK